VSSLAKRTGSKFGWLIFAIGVLGFITGTEIIGKIFFINRTESMPRGIYLKQAQTKLKSGDIIVFYFDEFKSNLVKYVVGVASSEFCIDQEAILWLDSFPVAQLNIEKYPSKKPDQSQCQRLATDEILVIGEHPDSYDSRYFGPIKLERIIAKVELLWEF